MTFINYLLNTFDKYHIISLIEESNEQNKLMSKTTRETHMETENTLTAAGGKGREGTSGKKGKGLVKEHV